MDRSELMTILPHRDGMLLPDSAAVEDGVSRGKRYIRGDEWFLQGHFPGDPVVPGVMLCELLAQTACVLLAGTLNGQAATLLTGLDKVRFKEPVRPGDTVETECRLMKSRPPFYWASGSAFMNGKKCMSADFSFAVYQR